MSCVCFRFCVPTPPPSSPLAELNSHSRMLFPTRDWSGLEGFRKLETLCIGDLTSGDSVENLATALRNMGTVTELCVTRMRPPADIVADALFGLDQLRSLTLTLRSDRLISVWSTLASLTNLTELVICSRHVNASVCELTGLVRLGVICTQRVAHFTYALSKLRLLEELDLVCMGDVCLSGYMFVLMTRLKKLSITSHDLNLEEDFFAVLGSLQKLTSLQLDSKFATEWDTCQPMSKITLLTNLRELFLRQGTNQRRRRADPLRNFDQNSLPKLQTLQISSFNSMDRDSYKPQTKFSRLNNRFLSID